MWYFAWILGLGFACAFAVLNAMWLEFDDNDDVQR
jgi:cyd operon protein YbgT